MVKAPQAWVLALSISPGCRAAGDDDAGEDQQAHAVADATVVICSSSHMMKAVPVVRVTMVIG